MDAKGVACRTHALRIHAQGVPPCVGASQNPPKYQTQAHLARRAFFFLSDAPMGDYHYPQLARHLLVGCSRLPSCRGPPQMLPNSARNPMSIRSCPFRVMLLLAAMCFLAGDSSAQKKKKRAAWPAPVAQSEHALADGRSARHAPRLAIDRRQPC